MSAVEMVILLFSHRTTSQSERLRSVLGGRTLGACNDDALFSLTRVLSVNGWQSALIFPCYSVGVVVASTLGAAVLFAERTSRRRLTGLCIGLVSVVAFNLWFSTQRVVP